MTDRLLILVLAAACTPPAPMPPTGAYVEFGVVGGGDVPSPHGSPPVEPTRDQPAHIKLKLGHYRNHRFGIGATIDLVSAATENVADIDPAKLLFDGEAKVWLLRGRHGGNGRIDYVGDGDRVMLHLSRDGHYTVYIFDPETDRASEAIDLYRDGDADPL